MPESARSSQPRRRRTSGGNLRVTSTPRGIDGVQSLVDALVLIASEAEAAKDGRSRPLIAGHDRLGGFRPEASDEQ
jgi:hypothetical protein